MLCSRNEYHTRIYIERGFLLTNKLLTQGTWQLSLKSSLSQVATRNELTDRYVVSVLLSACIVTKSTVYLTSLMNFSWRWILPWLTQWVLHMEHELRTLLCQLNVSRCLFMLSFVFLLWHCYCLSTMYIDCRMLVSSVYPAYQMGCLKYKCTYIS